MLRVLLPVDGSENSDRAVKALIRQLPLFREVPEVHLMNVQHPFPGTVHRVQHLAEQAHREEGLRALASARKLLEDAGVRYTQYIGVGDVAGLIARYVKDNNIKQIAMGTRGRSAIVGLLLGSTTQKVVHLTDVPVLLVK
ncbi:MAG: universal stress protein [Betaproteobacteria bacterium]|nr:universal stress protein [Betaproteobacteria bacterium]